MTVGETEIVYTDASQDFGPRNEIIEEQIKNKDQQALARVKMR